VFLDDAVEKKYPNAPKEFIHQWFFPQQSLTLVGQTGQRRRYHLHSSLLEEALIRPGQSVDIAIDSRHNHIKF